MNEKSKVIIGLKRILLPKKLKLRKKQDENN
jgi:hypothetical protein